MMFHVGSREYSPSPDGEPSRFRLGLAVLAGKCRRNVRLIMSIVLAVALLALLEWYFYTLIFWGPHRERFHRVVEDSPMIAAVTGYKRPIPRFERLPMEPTRLSHHCDIFETCQRCVPRTVHITYHGEILPHHELLAASLSPKYTFHYYSDVEADHYMATKCPEYYAVFTCFIPSAYKADVFRYCVLLHEGGIYLDNDFALLVRPEELYDEDCQGLYLMAEYSADVGRDVRLWTGFMISSRNQSMWRCMLDAISDNVVRRYYGDDPVDVTGPGLLAKCVDKDPHSVHTYGFNERDGTMWGYPDPQTGSILQIGHEVGNKYKGQVHRNGGRIHYSEQWRNRAIFNESCRLHAVST
eukprot:m.185529 g.185529  ORF g.185529 m.185529 type:complete len:354 (+) comp16469_c0_seq1:403-1464(+)